MHALPTYHFQLVNLGDCCGASGKMISETAPNYETVFDGIHKIAHQKQHWSRNMVYISPLAIDEIPFAETVDAEVTEALQAGERIEKDRKFLYSAAEHRLPLTDLWEDAERISVRTAQEAEIPLRDAKKRLWRDIFRCCLA